MSRRNDGGAIHPIEEQSYRILHEQVDLSSWPTGPAALAARVLHATADPSLLEQLVIPPDAVDAAIAALRAGAPVLCDVEMVRVAISGVDVRCALQEITEISTYPSRTAAGIAREAERHRDGAIFVVGCAPTALAVLSQLIEQGTLRPALVIATPVGYVGAAERTAELLSLAERTGVHVIALAGRRGGAAVAAALTNALVRLAEVDSKTKQNTAALVIGHGTRSDKGAAELRAFARALRQRRRTTSVHAGFIEFVEPTLDEAIDELVAGGADSVVGLPLLLLGAGHLKDDGPAALARARRRHPAVSFHYARDLGVHPLVLATVSERITSVRFNEPGWPGGSHDAVVVVGRGSSDPDANADLVKAARLLADGRGLGNAAFTQDGTTLDLTPALGLVEPAFVSLARPSVLQALDRCAALGARRIAVVPYFLFTGILVDRIATLTQEWGELHPGIEVRVGEHIGVDERLVELAWSRFDEALGAGVSMNCDGCLYRIPLPGYEERVGTRPE